MFKTKEKYQKAYLISNIDYSIWFSPWAAFWIVWDPFSRVKIFSPLFRHVHFIILIEVIDVGWEIQNSYLVFNFKQPRLDSSIMSASIIFYLGLIKHSTSLSNVVKFDRLTKVSCLMQ